MSASERAAAVAVMVALEQLLSLGRGGAKKREILV